MTASLIGGLAHFAMLGALVWLPLFPALAWGKASIPGPEIRKLLGRAFKISAAVGLPVMFIMLFSFARMNPERPPLGELAARCAAASVGFLPLYAALVATSVFQARHRAARESGAARPFAVRLLAGIVILLANLFAGLLMGFTLIAGAGTYRGWN